MKTEHDLAADGHIRDGDRIPTGPGAWPRCLAACLPARQIRQPSSEQRRAKPFLPYDVYPS